MSELIDTSVLQARQRRRELGSGATPLEGHSKYRRRDAQQTKTRSAALGFIAGGLVAALLLGAIRLLYKKQQSAEPGNAFEGSVGPVYTGRVDNSRTAGRHDCGVWQKEYAYLHADILSSEVPQRYATVHCTRGLADCLEGAVTVFFYALVSRRAFQMHLPAGASYEAAFHAPNVNWTYTLPPRPEAAVTYEVTDANKHTLFAMFQSGDIKQFAKEHDFVNINLGWGAARFVSDNPYMRGDLYQMGLRPETMVGCVLDFLVAPSPQMQAHFAQELALLNDVRPLKIGIQIRIPSYITREDNLTLDNFSSFFECAKEIEATRRAPGQAVIWYFISDSLYLRRLVKRAYGSKVLTSLDPQYHLYATAQADKVQDHNQSLLTAAGELWLFSLVDYHVLSLDSNFGAAGALWSRRWHHMYNIDNKSNRRRKCGVVDYDTVDTHFF